MLDVPDIQSAFTFGFDYIHACVNILLMYLWYNLHFYLKTKDHLVKNLIGFMHKKQDQQT